MNLILQTLQHLNNKMGKFEDGQAQLYERVGRIKDGQSLLNERVGQIEEGHSQMNQRVNSIDTELKEFRLETRTSFQMIQTGQQGTLEEMTQRFKEVKQGMDSLQKDIELTYQKTALNELQLNRQQTNQ